MEYEFRSHIDCNEFDAFVKKYPSTLFMQTSSWADVKAAWEHDLVGMYQNGRLMAAAMILKRKLFLNKKLFYIPRGFVIDYKNEALLTCFVNHLKTYAKKNGAIDIKIDPFICFSEENIQTIRKKKNVEILKSFSQDTKEIVENLEKQGFQHGGYRKEVNAYIQPRYTMVVSLKDKDGKPYEKEALRRTFPRNTRNYIGRYHEERGVEFSYSHNPKDVSVLAEMLKSTEDRQHIALRDQQYFETLMKNFPDNAVLFFAKVNIRHYMDFLRKDMAENESKKEFCEHQLSEAQRLQKKYGDMITAGATIVMMPTAKNGIRTASFLYAGTNTEVLPTLKITNGLMFYRLCYCLDHGCDYCDLGGIDGSLEDHLATFKSKFNPNVLELVGEYDLVINKMIFSLFNWAMDLRKKLLSHRE